MNVHVFLTAYALADDLVRTYDAATADNVTFLLFLHSMQRDVVAACEALAAHSNVVYFPHGENRGMSRSINDAILYSQSHGADIFASINDDVLCPAARLQELARAAIAHSECAYVEAQGYTERVGKEEPLGFSCCAWSMDVFEQVGLFDENFHPFYFMDCDWKRRALLLGYESMALRAPDVIHAGSKTLTHGDGDADWLSGAFANTFGYYLAKWGGDQKQESYGCPFNDNANGLYISPAQRHDPYPVYRPAFRGEVA